MTSDYYTLAQMVTLFRTNYDTIRRRATNGDFGPYVVNHEGWKFSKNEVRARCLDELIERNNLIG